MARSHRSALRLPAKAASGALRAGRWPPKGDVAVRPERRLSLAMSAVSCFSIGPPTKKSKFSAFELDGQGPLTA
jgi:hypothetical protein